MTPKMRWVAPPNWPTMPPGFAPPPGWQPDASWPAPPPGWQFWRPQTGEASEEGNVVRGAAVAVVVGGFIAGLATLGPWIHLNAGFASVSSNGLSNGWDGWAPLVAGVVAVIAGACRLGDWTTPKLLSNSPIWLGLWAVGWDIADMVQVSHHVSQAKAASPLIIGGGTGYGLGLSLAGGVLVLVGGFAEISGTSGVRSWALAGFGSHPTVQSRSRVPEPPYPSLPSPTSEEKE